MFEIFGYDLQLSIRMQREHLCNFTLHTRNYGEVQRNANP